MASEYFGEAPHGVMFHHFHGKRHVPSQGSITGAELETVLDFIGPKRILTPEEWLVRLAEGSLEPQALCLTFDDALLSQIDIALPVLHRLGLKAFWFVYSSVFEGQISKFEIYRAFRSRYFSDPDEFCTQFTRRIMRSPFAERAHQALVEEEIERIRRMFPFYTRPDVEFRLIRDKALTLVQYERFMDEWIAVSGLDVQKLAANLWMSDDHLRQLSRDGHVVGLHSYSHPMVMGTLPYEEQRTEYEKNLRHIRRVSSKSVVTMAHPANSYSQVTLNLLSTLGVQCGFRSNMTAVAPGGKLNPNRLELAREDHANIIRLLREGVNG